ncbi:hypothetical protein HHK36_030410 [Tetracentron sinense]|uniref:RRP15-like protein n=1 Tax=Tetracentron sinense TaxID=13715 RepID=A0A835D1I9_TETSI|nr:hypothetical protein HHK36_030410 [Tetracentron sinense]
MVNSMKVAKTVLEVADVAWTAIECRHHHHHHDHDQTAVEERHCCSSEEDLMSLRSENRRLRNLLDQNLQLLQHLSDFPSLVEDCPPDLYVRLVATVDSNNFLTQLESMRQASIKGPSNDFPFKETTGGETLINLDADEPSWWVWVTDEMVPSNIEEGSGIDKESYVIVNEEHVVDGVANFIARCILSNPKAQRLTPEQLQKTVMKALSGMNKVEKMMNVWHAWNMFYALSTWGLALTGLYTHRSIVKAAAKGIKASSKVVLRAL